MINLHLKFICCGLFSLLAINSLLAQDDFELKHDVPIYLLGELNHNRVLLSQEMDTRYPPASLTKVMTTYIIAKSIKENKTTLDTEFIVSEKAWKQEGSRMFLELNSSVSVDNLLKGLIVQSGNDAAYTLAEGLNGSLSKFVESMNRTAQDLGLNDTHFTNANGLPDPQNFSTANDLFKLSINLIKNFPEIYAYHKIKEFKYNEINQFNRNSLLWTENFEIDGLKTGHLNESGYHLIASAVKDEMRLVCVVMGAKSKQQRKNACFDLLFYGFNNYTQINPIKKGNSVYSVDVRYGTKEQVSLQLKEDIRLTIYKSYEQDLIAVIKLNNEVLEAPIQTNQIYGYLKLKLNDEILVEKPLYAIEKVDKAGLFKIMLDKIKFYYNKMVN